MWFQDTSQPPQPNLRQTNRSLSARINVAVTWQSPRPHPHPRAPKSPQKQGIALENGSALLKESPNSDLAPRCKHLSHTWLAWQETAGMPMGQAITARVLRHDCAIALTFVKWLQHLFERIVRRTPPPRNRWGLGERGI